MSHTLSSRPALPSRREFIRRAGAAFILGSCLPSRLALAGDPAPAVPATKPLVGCNLYVWTQYAQREKKPVDLEAVMKSLHDSGYDYLEGFLKLDQPEETVKFAELSRKHGLQPVSLYVGPRLHEAATADAQVARVLAAAKVMQKEGFQVLSVNAEPIGREKTDEELKTQAAALVKIGEGLNAMGMKLGVHQHMPEMAKGAREFHYNFDYSKPDVVGWCYDVHWVWKGGIMPLDGLKEYGDRVVTWHIRQSHDRVWCENLEAGDVDYPAVAKYVAEHKLPQRFSVELALQPETKITRSVEENHKISREYIRKVFGV